MPSGVRGALKVAALVVVVAVVVWLLFALVFPWVDRQLNDPVLGAAVAHPGMLLGQRPPA